MKYNKKRIASNLCTKCGKPKTPGYKQCEACRQYERNRVAFKRLHGICVDCSKKATHGVRCEHCANRNRNSLIKRRERGLCQSCNTVVTGVVQCGACRLKRKQERQARIQAGLCGECGRERENLKFKTCTCCRSNSYRGD